LAEAPPRGFGLSLAVAVVAIFLSIAAISFAYLGASSPVSELQQEVSTMQSQLNQLQGLPKVIPLVNSTPVPRNITVQWETFGTGQDRFFPDYIIVNQGDTLRLTFINNDTGDAHTFTIALPTAACPNGCEYQINESRPGLTNFLTDQSFTQDALNCMVDGNNIPCNNIIKGPIGNMSGTITFTVIKPGVYRFFCYYHQRIGMFGFLVVLPNAGYRQK
jgi:plastocyanin